MMITIPLLMVAPAAAPYGTVTEFIVRILDSKEVREMLAAQGADPGKGTPADLAAFSNREIAKWAKVIKDGNIQVE